MTPGELVRRYPRLYHAARPGTWETVRRHGLLTVSQLVRTSGLPPGTQRELLTRRRDRAVRIAHPLYGPVVLRDQAHLREHVLKGALTDMTVPEWLEMLNSRVFFWPRLERLRRVLGARASRGVQYEVITLDTASVLERCGPAVRLSAVNSGSAMYPSTGPRGSHTFATVADFPGGRLRLGGARRDAVAEVAVIGGIAAVERHVVRVERYHGDQPGREIYPRSPVT
jgi:hypothetical protein